MKKKFFIIFFIFLLIVLAIFYYCFNFKQDNNITDDFNGSESSSNQDSSAAENISTKPIETNISTFSTKIYTKDSARQNNINITCNSINDTVIKKQETFSFCDIVGMATTEKGYQKADIFDKDGNKKKGLRWWKLPGK